MAVRFTEKLYTHIERSAEEFWTQVSGTKLCLPIIARSQAPRKSCTWFYHIWAFLCHKTFMGIIPTLKGIIFLDSIIMRMWTSAIKVREWMSVRSTFDLSCQTTHKKPFTNGIRIMVLPRTYFVLYTWPTLRNAINLSGPIFSMIYCLSISAHQSFLSCALYSKERGRLEGHSKCLIARFG